MLSPDLVRLGVVVYTRQIGEVVERIIKRDAQLVNQFPRRRFPYPYHPRTMSFRISSDVLSSPRRTTAAEGETRGRVFFPSPS